MHFDTADLFAADVRLFHFVCRVRDLTTDRIGALTKITGQVVRTHPVHPELVSGVFTCLDCRTVIKDVEQQFKYTQVCVGIILIVDSFKLFS